VGHRAAVQPPSTAGARLRRLRSRPRGCTTPVWADKHRWALRGAKATGQR